MVDIFSQTQLNEQFENIEKCLNGMLRDLTLKYDEAAEARIQDPFTPWIKDQINLLSNFVLGEYILWCKGFNK
jgi:hypothetical protein